MFPLPNHGWPTVHSRYKRISNKLSVNSALKINKMALFFARIKLGIVFSRRLRTYTFFSGPNQCGPIVWAQPVWQCGPVVDFIQDNV